MTNAPLVMITASTPYNEGAPAVGFRANDGTDYFDLDQAYPISTNGLLFDVGATTAWSSARIPCSPSGRTAATPATARPSPATSAGPNIGTSKGSAAVSAGAVPGALDLGHDGYRLPWPCIRRLHVNARIASPSQFDLKSKAGPPAPPPSREAKGPGVIPAFVVYAPTLDAGPTRRADTLMGEASTQKDQGANNFWKPILGASIAASRLPRQTIVRLKQAVEKVSGQRNRDVILSSWALAEADGCGARTSWSGVAVQLRRSRSARLARIIR